MMEQNETLTKERYELALGRIQEIATQQTEEVPPQFAVYFKEAAQFLVKMDELLGMAVSGEVFSQDISAKKELNQSLYAELLDDNYEKSFCNYIC